MVDIRIVRWALLGAFGLTATLSASAVMAQQTGPSERSAAAQDAPYQYREGAQPRADREADDSDDDDDTDMDQSPDRGDMRPGQQERADRQDWRERDDGRERDWRRRERGGDRFGREERDRGPRRPMMGPTVDHGAMMRHHGMMMGMMRLCGPNGGGMADRMLDRLEALTNPMDAQRETFQQLKDAAGKAVEIARAGCTSERAITPPGRLAAAEKRLESLLQAVKTVRPAMDAFYGMLSDEQKARLYIAHSRSGRMGGGHHGGNQDWRSDDRRGSWRERGAERPYGELRGRSHDGWRNEESRGRPNWRDGEREREREERPRRGPRDDDRDTRSGDWRGQL